MLSLTDVYRDLDSRQSVKRIKELLAWIESLPISHMPFVEMGFDALHEDLIKGI